MYCHTSLPTQAGSLTQDQKSSLMPQCRRCGCKEVYHCPPVLQRNSFKFASTFHQFGRDGPPDVGAIGAETVKTGLISVIFRSKSRDRAVSPCHSTKFELSSHCNQFKGMSMARRTVQLHRDSCGNAAKCLRNDCRNASTWPCYGRRGVPVRLWRQFSVCPCRATSETHDEF